MNNKLRDCNCKLLLPHTETLLFSHPKLKYCLPKLFKIHKKHHRRLSRSVAYSARSHSLLKIKEKNLRLKHHFEVSLELTGASNDSQVYLEVSKKMLTNKTRR